jgi:hypothetical protein
MTSIPTTDLRDLTAMCAVLGLEQVPELWAQTWPQSARSFAPGQVFFLDAGHVGETCQTLHNSAGVTEALLECAAAVRESPALERLAWHLHWLLCLSGLDLGGHVWVAPPVEAHPAGAMFYGLVVASGLPRLLELHGARGLDPEDTIETLSDLETWTADHQRWEGSYRFTNMGWMQHHLRGRLLKIGRLQYLPGTYYHPFRWYRQQGTDRVIALAEDGLLLRGDGQFASADGGEVREGLWKSRFTGTLESVTGHPVSPLGQVLPQTVTLDTAEWHEVLRRGDPVMTVHIPAKGRMDPEACAASFRRAVDVYRRHYPEIIWRAFTCNSWLLDPQFELLDPPPPNICAFLREWYLHPAEGADDSATWERIFDLFGRSAPDWDKAPQDTSLRRAAVTFTQAGGRLRGGGGVIFPDDLDGGQQVYRGPRRAEVLDL